jgi:hypothetical protein
MHFAGTSAQSLRSSLLLRSGVVIGRVDGASLKLESRELAFEGSMIEVAEGTDYEIVGESVPVATTSLISFGTVGVLFVADSKGG